MALSKVRKVFLLCCVSAVTTYILVQQSDVLFTMQSLKTSEIEMQKWFFLPKEKETKWKRCQRLIAGENGLRRTFHKLNDLEISDIYKPNQDCGLVLKNRFGHPRPTKEEKRMPIAYGFTIYDGARLFERLLQAVYMPHNIYCVHIDKKSSKVFRKAIKAIISCLPNVFISKSSIDVIWGHFTLVEAQMSCMEELLQSKVKWKYYISLIGQDFPLYDNKQIVKALKSLNNTNNIDSYLMPTIRQRRTKFAFTFEDGQPLQGEPKSPPPHNISIYKGSTHIIAIREFVQFVLYSTIGKEFTEFLKDTLIPDETIYSSLHQLSLAPGGIQGEQPLWIARAISKVQERLFHNCYGFIVRGLCWITFEDLQWALGEEEKEKLFVHKLPFNVSEDLIECLLVARQGREYATPLWKQDEIINFE